MTGSTCRATANAAGISTRVADAPLPAPQWRQRLMTLLQLHDLGGEAGRDLRRSVFERGELSPGYMLMCLLSAGIATLGLLQSSVAVVIGAMLVSPLMTPIAALGFGLATFDAPRLRDAAKVVAIGAFIGIATGMLVTWISPIDDITPEILARTEPTLLDLAVALLSGIAGGYAIVRRQGETAIGVAIATALMPPLATVGYGIAALRSDIAGGALLLFLTNLTAIAIAIASVARLTGAAAPRRGLHIGMGVKLLGVLLIIGLLVPLGSTLFRLQREVEARAITQRSIRAVLDVPAHDISQLSVSWPLRGAPEISAVVITPRFAPDAPAEIAAKIAAAIGQTPKLSLQQIEIGSGVARSEAMIAAALARNAEGNVGDEPPYAEIRAALELPVTAFWHDSAAHIVHAQLAAAPGWTIADYASLDPAGGRSFGSWVLRIVPPPQAVLRISDDQARATADTAAALWALKAWGLRNVSIRLRGGEDFGTRASAAPIAALQAELARAGIATQTVPGAELQAETEIVTLPPPPRAVATGVDGE